MNEPLQAAVVEPTPNTATTADWATLAKLAADSIQRTVAYRPSFFEKMLTLARVLGPALILLVATALVLGVYKKSSERLAELETAHKTAIAAVTTKSEELAAGDAALANAKSEFSKTATALTNDLTTFQNKENSPVAIMRGLSKQLNPEDGLGKKLQAVDGELKSLTTPTSNYQQLLRSAAELKGVFTNDRLASRLGECRELLERTAYGEFQPSRRDVIVVFPHNGRLGIARTASAASYDQLRIRVPFIGKIAAHDKVNAYEADSGQTNDNLTYDLKNWQIPGVGSIPIVLIVPPQAESPPALSVTTTGGPTSPAVSAGWWNGRSAPVDVVFLHDGTNERNEAAWRAWSFQLQPKGFFVVVSGNWNNSAQSDDERRLVEAVSMMVWNRAMAPIAKSSAEP